MRDSVEEKVKMVRMFLQFHPHMMLATLIFKIVSIVLVLVAEISSTWGALKLRLQSEVVSPFFKMITVLLDSIDEKIEKQSEALQKRLINDAVKGHPIGILTFCIVPTVAICISIFTYRHSEFDERLIQMESMFAFCLCPILLLSLSELRKLRVLRKRRRFILNSVSNTVWFALGVHSGAFLDNSLCNWILLSNSFPNIFDYFPTTRRS